MQSPVEVAPVPSGDHVVNLYDRDEDLIADVGSFLAEGLEAGDAVIVVATPGHLASFEDRLEELAVDIDAARAGGRYVSLDASETLSQVMADGSAHAPSFTGIFDRLIADAREDGRSVRIFGEMVAVLWEAGDLVAAIDLEGLWNVIQREHSFSLYCSYPMAELDAADDINAVHRVCSNHSSVVGPRGDHTRLPEAQEERRLSRLFVPVASAVGAARQFVVDTLREWDVASLEEAKLIVSELATNAVVHAGSPFRVTVTRDDSTVRIESQDASPSLQPSSEADQVGGHGLVVVAGLSSRWGSHLRPDGKDVWAELPVELASTR